MPRPTVGSADWESAGGPALSIGQRIGLLAGMGCVLADDASGRLGRVVLPRWRQPELVDLDVWAPPDTPATRAAKAFLNGSSSREFIEHGHRCYYFAAIAYEVAAAITANLNPFVPAGIFGAEAHYFRVGGLMDVLAQGWKVHPDNVRTIVERHPRDGFGADTARVIRQEVDRNPGCRFACYGPAFPALVRATRFRIEE